MRFDELQLKIPGDELRIRFHEHLTVLTGIGLLERQALADSILGAVTGEVDAATLSYTDGSGRRVVIATSGGQASSSYEDDGSAAAPLLGAIAPDADGLRTLMLLQSGDLGLNSQPRGDEPAELAEARVMLQELTDQLQAAMTTRLGQESLRAEREETERAIRQAQDGAARREYATVLGELERVRAEASALQSGDSGIDADRHLLENADATRELATSWSAATARLSEIANRFGKSQRLDDQTLCAARDLPDELPQDLAVRLDACDKAAAHRDEVDRRLHDLAESKLPEPSDRLVVDLARVNQDMLWDANARLLRAGERLAEAEMSMGGLSTGAEAMAVNDGVESAHSDVEEAERSVRRRMLPGVAGTGASAMAGLAGIAASPLLAGPMLAGAAVAAGVSFLAPRMKLAKARRAEEKALDTAAAPSYLAFHIRRVEATVDPDVRGRLDSALHELEAAATRWTELAAGAAPELAAQLEPEVRAYDIALRSLGGAADEIEHLRIELLEHADPALARAHAHLLELTRSFGIDDVAVNFVELDTIDRLVHQQLALGRSARVQDELQQAEADEEKLGARLDDLLNELGFGQGTIEARVGALDWAVSRAEDREQARAMARSRDEIEADLVRLQESASRLRRPEWASVTSADAETPDLETLQARRAELNAILGEQQSEVDVELLADRHSALERRVSALESRYDGLSSAGSVGALADVHQYLLAHLTRAAHCGPHDEAVPVVLDDVFLRIPAERKWDLLDMLHRLSEKTQLVYLTDDPFVTSWARRRAASGLVTLMEPAPEMV